jgi:DNA-binding MarR family transcriptional regulator
MADNNEFLRNLLGQLGYSPEETNIFLRLNFSGPLTILELSRKTSIPRTSLYRLIENLKTKGLIEEIIDQYKIKIQAVSPDQLETITKSKTRQLNQILTDFSQIKDSLHGRQTMTQPGTKVVFFRGVEGIKQILWNELQANKLIQGYLYQNIQEVTGDKFMEEWNREWLEKKIKIYALVSDRYLKNRLRTRHFGNWENVTRHYLPDKKLDINTNMDIYNDVTAYFSWLNDDVFGVEIHNKEIAELQKQVHLKLWKDAFPMTRTISTEKRSMPIIK